MVPAFKELTSWSRRLEDSFLSATESAELSGMFHIWAGGLGGAETPKEPPAGNTCCELLSHLSGTRTWVTGAIETNPRCPQRATEEGTGLGLAPAHTTSASGTC